MEHREGSVSRYSIYGVYRRNNWVTMFVNVSNMEICMHLDDMMTSRLLLSKFDPRGELFSRVLCISVVHFSDARYPTCSCVGD